MDEAVAKFNRLEQRGQALCKWFDKFIEDNGQEFVLKILPSGDYGTWEWTGGNVDIPVEKILELGELMAGLRSCLDLELYQMSREEVERRLVKRRQISFPCLRHADSWHENTVPWLTGIKRQRIRQAQRFGERRKRNIDCVVLSTLASYDKHRALIQAEIGGASYGQIGGEDGISKAWATELGLGSEESGWYSVGTVHGGARGKMGKGNVVVEGPLGGMALMGTIPTVQIRFSGDLELDDEDDRKRLARASVPGAIKQVTWEVRDILEIMSVGTTKMADSEVSEFHIEHFQGRMELATRAAQIYRHIPQSRDARVGWSMHLKQLPSHSLETNNKDAAR